MTIEPASRVRFEGLGLSLMRIDVPVGAVISDNLRDQALERIAEQEDAQTRRESWGFRVMIFLTAIAAIAACIAAWPVIKAH
jgi:hypothetical protein